MTSGISAPPRTVIDTDASGTLKASIALLKAIRSIRRSEDNVEVVPGWRVLHPSANELAEVREFQVLEAQVGSDVPFLLPRDGECLVMVEDGAVDIRDDNCHLIGDLNPAPNPYFKHKGEIRRLRAIAWPTSVLVISYRERVPDDDAKSSI